MTEKMKMMLNEIIERDMSIKEIMGIMRALNDVRNDRMTIENFIHKRFLEDNPQRRMELENRIRWFEDIEKDDKDYAESVFREYELNYDIDELLGTEKW